MHYVLNLHALHNHMYLRQLLPATIGARVAPAEDRDALHLHASTSLRDTKLQKKLAREAQIRKTAEAALQELNSSRVDLIGLDDSAAAGAVTLDEGGDGEQEGRGEEEASGEESMPVETPAGVLPYGDDEMVEPVHDDLVGQGHPSREPDELLTEEAPRGPRRRSAAAMPGRGRGQMQGAGRGASRGVGAVGTRGQGGNRRSGGGGRGRGASSSCEPTAAAAGAPHTGEAVSAATEETDVVAARPRKRRRAAADPVLAATREAAIRAMFAS